MNPSIFNITFKFVAFLLTFLLTFGVQADESIVNLTANKIIGFKESPTVYVELEIDKTRDLHVAFQNMNGFKTVKRTMKRIKKSGKYHFEVPLDKIDVGNYRIAAYLTPRGKDWNDRITQAQPFMFEVVNAEKYVKKSSFSKQDKIKFVKWPKRVIGNQEATLTIQYDIQAPRDIHVKLLDSDNWKEHGALKFPVTEPGNLTLPLSNLTVDFPLGNYAWVVYVAEKGKSEPISDKFGKHFTLAKKQKQSEGKSN